VDAVEELRLHRVGPDLDEYLDYDDLLVIRRWYRNAFAGDEVEDADNSALESIDRYIEAFEGFAGG
jgi:hypothetical protein